MAVLLFLNCLSASEYHIYLLGIPIVENSDLTHCTISENCSVINTKLTNVIMLPGSKVVNQNMTNQIVGFDENIESEAYGKV